MLYALRIPAGIPAGIIMSLLFRATSPTPTVLLGALKLEDGRKKL